jgi:hypothetical protein
MDHWHPRGLTDGFARDREVILFNNAVSPALAVRFRVRLKKWRSNVHRCARR